MPNLQELVNRNRGVTIYNPTRAIIPRRGRANAGTASGILQQDDNPEQRRQSQIGQRSGQSGMEIAQGRIAQRELPAYQAAVAPVGYSPGALLSRVSAEAPQQDEEPSGFLGTVIGSGPGRAIMGALEVLDYPRRFVTSAVQEGVDAINGGDASWGDFTQQMSDPTFGFGDIIGDTGNKWLNRIVGFTGDVLLDPLTYVAGAGLISGTGRAARTSTAAAARAAGIGEDVAQRVGRYGLSVLDNAERQVLRDAGVQSVRDAGYYFRTPLSARFTGQSRDLRIPLTGRLERGVTGTFARGRAALGDTRGATALRRWRSPAGQEDAWRKILTGQGAMPFDEAAAIVTFSDASRMAGQTFTSRLNAESQSLIQQAAGSGRLGANKAGNQALTDLIHKAETEGGTLVNDIFNSALKMMQEVGVTRPARKNYVPHQVTEGAAEWLRGESVEARHMRDRWFPGAKIDDISPSMMERRLVPGANPELPVQINGKDFYIREGTIKEFNDQFAKLVPNAGFKFFEDDYSNIIARYAKSMSDDVGMVAGVRRLLNSKGNFVKRIGNEITDITEDVIDDVLRRHGDPEMASQLMAKVKSQSETIKELRDGIANGVVGIQGTLAPHVSEAIGELTTVRKETKRVLQDLLARETGLTASLPGGRPGGLTGPSAPEGPTELEIAFAKEIGSIDDQITALDDEAAAILEKARTQYGDEVLGSGSDAAKLRSTLDRWTEINQLRARLALDVETIKSVADQMHAARRTAKHFNAAAADTSFLNLSAGTQNRPKRVEVREQIAINPEHAVRLKYGVRRRRLLANRETRVQELEASIEVQETALARAQERLTKTTESYDGVVRRAADDYEFQQGVQQAYRDEAESLVGDPAMHETQALLSKRAYDHRTTGELVKSKQFFEKADEPIRAARERVAGEQKLLDELVAERNKVIAVGQGGMSSERTVQALLDLEAERDAAIAAARKADPVYREGPITAVEYQGSWNRDRRYAETQYTGSLPSFMDPEDRAELVAAHRIVRDKDLTTKAKQDKHRQARETIKRIEAEYADALTPAQKARGIQADSPLQAIDNQLQKLRKIRDVPYAFPAEGTSERAALMLTRDQGGDYTTAGRANAAREAAFYELQDLPLAGDPDQIGRAMLDHDLVRSGLIDTEMLGRLSDEYEELGELLSQYQRIPMPLTRRNIEKMTRDMERDAEMMTRLRAAHEGGVEVDDRVASFLMHRQLKAESESLKNQIDTIENALSSPSKIEAEIKFAYAYEAQKNKVAELRTEHANVTTERRELMELQKQLKMQGGGLDAEQRARFAFLTNRRSSLKRAVRKAERNFYRLKPPALGVIGDDVNSITSVLEEHLRDVIEAQAGVTRAKRLGEWAMKNAKDRDIVLANKIRSAKRTIYSMDMRARRVEEAIATAEGAGSPTATWEHYELPAPGKPGRRQVTMTVADAYEDLQKWRRTANGWRGKLDQAQMEHDVITGRADREIEKIDRLLQDQVSPPDINRLYEDGERLAQIKHPTPAQRERMEFLMERIELLEEGAPAARLEELTSLKTAYETKLAEVDEMKLENIKYLRATMRGKDQYFNDLVKGNRDITLKDMKILSNMLGGEKAEAAAGMMKLLREGLENKEVISYSELRVMLDHVAAASGNREAPERLFDEALLSPTIDEAGNVVGTEGIKNGFVEMMVEAEDMERRARTEQLAEFLNLVDIPIANTNTDAVLRALGQDLNSIRRQGYDLKRDEMPIDRSSLQDAVIKHLARTGWSPENSVQAKVNDLKQAKRKVDQMRRGLGSTVVAATPQNPEAFFRWMRDLDNVMNAERAGNVVSEAEAFKALLLPSDFDELYRNRMAAYRRDLEWATKEGNQSAIDEITRRMDELDNGASVQGVQIEPLGQQAAEPVEPPAAPQAELPPSGADRTDVPSEDRDRLATEREQLENQLTIVESEITAARSPAAEPTKSDPPEVVQLLAIKREMDTYDEIIDSGGTLTSEQAARSRELVDQSNDLQAVMRSKKMDPQEVLQRDVLSQMAGPVEREAADLTALMARRDQLSNELARVKGQQIEVAGRGDPSLPEAVDTDELVDLTEPLDAVQQKPDELLTLPEIDAEFARVVAEAKEIRARAANGAPALAEREEALVGRARTLRRLRREQMGELDRVGTPEALANQRLNAKVAPSVSYNWRSIWKSRAPSLSQVRQLSLSDQAMARKLAVVGAEPPTGVGAPLRDSIGQQMDAMLTSREDLLRTVQRERERLQAAGVRYEDLANAIEEAELPRLRQAETEMRQIEALEAKRQQAVVARNMAESNYTAKLNEIDQELADTRQMIAAVQGDADRLGAAKDRLKRVRDFKPKAKAPEFDGFLDDVSAVLESADDLPPLVVSDLSAQFESVLQQTLRLNEAESTFDFYQGQLTKMGKQADSIAETVKNLTKSGWRPIAQDIVTGADSMFISESLATGLNNLQAALRNDSTWKLLSGYTNFFKTYATARPGFHVRNLMSGIFMNLVDNVRIESMWRGLREYRKFKTDPAKYWENAAPEIKQAWIATWGSGAGGQFQEYGLGNAGTSWGRGHHLLMNNALTRWNRRAGERVEGSIRLSMALDSIARGESTEQALSRITKYHFDYTQVSTFDRKAKQLIPFWTFMSRNLPLQLESMWLRPRTYLQYQSLVRNFAESADPLTPEYWLAQGAFTLDENAEGREAPWYLSFDLPHLRVAEPFQTIAQGETGKALLQDVNPLFLAPYEAFVNERDTYTGRDIEGYEEPSLPLRALQPLLQLLGGTATGGQSGDTVVDQRYAHTARSLLPPLDQIERLLNNEGTREGRQSETLLRNFGAPVYRLTDNVRESTRRRNYYDERDAQAEQAELARM